MKTSLIQALIKDSDYYYDQKKHSSGRGKLKSMTISFEYNRNIFLEFDRYPELVKVAEQLIQYVQASEPIKQHEIKKQILELLEEVK